MARKLRLEFPGACYHVINRGNYRADIFIEDRTKAAFEACLFEACAKCRWWLHAFTIMRNHYHLALETPEGNLVAGMQWLQATFANRFNRLRGERGHLFQGRYKALLAEDGPPFAQVADYIHLNPVRAGIVSVQELKRYRYSSYWYLRQIAARPASLRLDLMLANVGGFVDKPAGWNAYRDHLIWQSVDGPLSKPEVLESLSHSWALGSAGFKSTLIEDHAAQALARAWEHEGAMEIRQRKWEELCRRAMQRLGRRNAELDSIAGSALWKVAIAAFLKERSEASNAWLGRRLKIGCPKYVSRLVAELHHREQPPDELLLLRGHGET